MSRRPGQAPADIGERFGADLGDAQSVLHALQGVQAAIFPPILTLSVHALPLLLQAGVPRAVFFSSHNVTVGAAHGAYAPLIAAEEAVRAAPIAWTILRPTLIYGDPRLTTMTSLARLAVRLPVMPCPGLGLARQQPVFVDDLAKVAAWAANSPEATGQVLSIGGPEVLRLRALYAAVSRSAGGTGLVAPVPFALLALIKRAMGDRFPLNDAQLGRARADKHITDPVILPEHIRPATLLTEGLGRLMRDLDQSGAQAASSQVLSVP